MTESVNHIHDMIDKAGKAEKSDDALKFSQAALNAANALASMKVNDIGATK